MCSLGRFMVAKAKLGDEPGPHPNPLPRQRGRGGSLVPLSHLRLCVNFVARKPLARGHAGEGFGVRAVKDGGLINPWQSQTDSTP